MSDDLDDLLRHAMKTLDDQVPPGYFEDLPKRTLARLEDDSSMQTDDRPLGSTGSPAAATSSTDSTATPAVVAEPAVKVAAVAAQREEDSGLHDIRSLASSQRMRISSKRTSQPSIGDDDDLIASSGSWKAVALPEPAKMISLPELAELPAARDIKELDKAARRAEKERAKEEARETKASRSSRHKVPTAPPAVGVDGAGQDGPMPVPVALSSPPAAPAAAVEPAAVTPIAAARAKRPTPAPAKAPAGQRAGSGKRNALIAVAGLGVAAAAGAAIVISTQNSSSRDQTAAAAESAKSAGAMPELDRRFSDRAAAPAAAQIAEPAAGSAAEVKADPAPPPPEATVEKTKVDPAPAKPTKGIGKMVPNVVFDPKEPEKKPDPNAGAGKKKDPNDPDFNKLLQEAGYQEKGGEKAKLDKKSLSGDDIKKGMNGVAAKAMACYDGQQGSAAVRLTVTPDGKIQKIAVSGVFAGTPAGACVEAAVRGAVFPPWDGGPQSINYSYLLSE